MFIAVTSIGAGGSPPPPAVNIARILPIPSYNAFAPTPAAAPPATNVTLSIAKS
jgi:hypothetical protein